MSSPPPTESKKRSFFQKIGDFFQKIGHIFGCCSEPPFSAPTPTPGHPTPGHPTPGPPTSGHPTSGPPTSGPPTSGPPTSGPPTSGPPTLAHTPPTPARTLTSDPPTPTRTPTPDRAHTPYPPTPARTLTPNPPTPARRPTPDLPTPSRTHTPDPPPARNPTPDPPTPARTPPLPPPALFGKGLIWKGVRTALRVLENSADACPPLKLVVSGLNACLDLTETVTGNNQEYKKLAEDLTSAMEALTPYMPKLVAEGGSGSLARIMKSIENESKHIVQQLSRSTIKQVVEAAQDQRDVIQRYCRIELLFRQLHNSINLQTWESTRKLLEKNLLEPVNDARYNSSYSTAVKRRQCTADTRQEILEDLKAWVFAQNGAKIYWMNGLAGTGKTTISYSLCEWLEGNGQLSGNYFCSRASPLCRNANNIVPSLAYQLAQYSPAFGVALCEILRKNPEASKLDVRWQFKKLIQEPMQTLTAAMSETVVIVIDALDECDNEDVLQLFLDTLLKLAMNLPIKFFITSRPESEIRERMSKAGHVLHLHDIEESIVEADIKKYLIEAFGSMSPPPSLNDIEQLTKRAGKLFIYAATAVRYIHPSDPDVNSRARLRTMLGTDSKPTKQYDELDRLYMDILSAAVNSKSRGKQEVDDILLILRTVICTKEPMSIQTLASFLTLTADRVYFALQPLRSILHVREREELVTPFHASLPDFLFDKDRSGKFHCQIVSHSEFLVNHCFDVMGGDLKFNICHLESSFLFDKDVPDMQERIQRSISPALSYACWYWGEHFHQGDLTSGVHRRLSEFLTYRLLFWMEVLNLQRRIAIGVDVLRTIQTRRKGFSSDTWKQVADAEVFLTRLTAGTCMHSTPHIYISGLAFCPRTSSVYKNYYRRTQGLMDMKESVVKQWQGKLISTRTIDSPVTSIAFSPDGLLIAVGFQDKTISVWDARTGEAMIGPLRGLTGCVKLVFSHDGTRIVSAAIDSTIQVWDARTGEVILNPLEGKGHCNSITSAALSLDGTHLVSACSHGVIKLWDLRTGEVVSGPEFGGVGQQGQSVHAVAFSHDSNYIVSILSGGAINVWGTWTGDLEARPFEGYSNSNASGTSYDRSTSHALSPDSTRVASGFYDGTIEIRDTYSGVTVVAFQADYESQRIESLVFSPDSTRIVSGTRRYVIRIWDARTGDALAGPFTGHTDLIRSIAFSPDNARIVSGSDDLTIRIWDTHTDDVTIGQLTGHTNTIRSVAFSPDSTRIVSSSNDRTIRVWNASTGDAVAGPFNGHTDSVTSVAFSPDGTRIVSGSDDHTIRVWDVRTGELVLGPLIGHTSPVNSVVFSPKGARIASGSTDGTIRIWGQTGDVMFRPHDSQINSIAFSPDGSRIVSGSDDFAGIWDAHTGDIVTGPFKGHKDRVKAVAFSPDGTRVASGACDRAVRVWDSYTGKEVTRPFTGHTQWVNSVSFSPDGSRIVSGSSDATVRIWDIYTGALVAITDRVAELPSGIRSYNEEPTPSVSVVGLLKGHTDSVYSVAFSFDGTRIVSGSKDWTIRVWDATVGPINEGTLKTSTDLSISHSLFSSQTPLRNLSIKNLIFRQDGWVISNDAPLFWIPPHFSSQLLYYGNTLVISPTGTPLIINSPDLFIGKKWSKCWRS